MTRQVVIIGAAGKMTQVATHALVRRFPDDAFVLCDYNADALAAVHGERAGANVRLQQLDLYDGDALAAVIRGCDLVINGAGPFYKTTAVVAQACIQAGVDYLDICDDNESTVAALGLDDAARQAGVGLYVGCGASPGVTNVLAAELIRQLDSVETVEVAWVVGDEGPQDAGRAVLEHVIHIGAGDCLTWRDGKPYTAVSFEKSCVMPMGGPLGDYRLYECAHPETVMLPHSFPDIRNAWCWGGMHPQAVNGVVKGVARAVRAGKLGMDEACDFLGAAMAEKPASLRGWKYALKGLFGQVVRGENSAMRLAGFIAASALKRHPPTLNATMAQVSGSQDGRRVLLRYTIAANPDHLLSRSMANATGYPQAAFASLVLTADSRMSGTVFPESMATLDEMMDALAALGASSDELAIDFVREVRD